MSGAIEYLGARGIMTGNTDGLFGPEKKITRAEFVYAVLKAFNLMDDQAQSNFPDVRKTDWFYAAAGTAQQLKFIEGYPDGTFMGNVDIPKTQMIAIVSRTMTQYMGYYPPEDIEARLGQFKDRELIQQWPREGIALAAKTGALIYRKDGNFDPDVAMTRGDAAIVLYKMFMKIW